MTNYRLLNDGEVIEQGDEFYVTGQWHKTIKFGLKHGYDNLIRRRPITDTQPVGTWITDRLPTHEDTSLDQVWVWRTDLVEPAIDRMGYLAFKHDFWPWQPIVAPEPYVAPGDPDPAVTLEVLYEMRNVYKSMPQLTCLSTWIKRIEESRSK